MNKIVIGLGFGDEGKGIFTDYLCSQSPNSLVIRFSGGHQVSHTVVTDDISHVFSNFGSGTLRGVPTYWSKYCTVEPFGLLNELKKLKDKGVSPCLYIDEKCPITTPYDIAINQLLEDKNCHGSCGVGFGTTIEREEKHYSLTFLDLFYPRVLKHKLDLIGNYYNIDVKLENYIQLCDVLINQTCIHKFNQMPRSSIYENYIYEGSQGLLLDQNYGFFPNVTRTNTGLTNIKIVSHSQDSELFLVTRAYQTRHGNGFMTNENIPHNISDNPLETNKENKYQGKFRKSLLDVSLLEYAIKKDEDIKHMRKRLVITCLDHIVNEYRFTYNGEIIYCSDEKEFIDRVSGLLNIDKVFVSRSNNSKNIMRFK